MANNLVRNRALQLLCAMCQEVESDIEQPVLPDKVAHARGIIDPSWRDYNEIYEATIAYLRCVKALVFVGEPFPGGRYYKITIDGWELLREESYPVTR
jgi:hypothetical protein